MKAGSDISRRGLLAAALGTLAALLLGRFLPRCLWPGSRESVPGALKQPRHQHEALFYERENRS